MCIDVEERFKRAKVATHINDIIKHIEPERKSMQWPQPGSIVPGVNVGAGPSDAPSNP